jgi:hypothetical protein
LPFTFLFLPYFDTPSTGLEAEAYSFLAIRPALNASLPARTA